MPKLIGASRPFRTHSRRHGDRSRHAASRITVAAVTGTASLYLTVAVLAADAPVRALVLPQRHATLASRLQATIDDIGPDNGERFRAGDVLIAFDCTGFLAELARADAAAEAARDTVRVKEELARSGSGSKLQAVLARTEVRRAAAEVTVARNQVEQCSIRAPYAGRVVKRIANAHETVGFRDPLMEIVDDSSVEVRAFVPSDWGPRLPTGTRFSVRVDETGGTVEAEVVSQAAWIDNISQLMEVRARVVRGGESLVAGMSGTACFPASAVSHETPAQTADAPGGTTGCAAAATNGGGSKARPQALLPSLEQPELPPASAAGGDDPDLAPPQRHTVLGSEP